jgi:ABC-type hemin transport system substrate-binding protein
MNSIIRIKSIIAAVTVLFLLVSATAFTQPTFVSLSSTRTEIVYALGAEDQLLGVTTFCVFPVGYRKR